MVEAGVSRRDAPALAVAALLLVVSLLPLSGPSGAGPTLFWLPVDVWGHLFGYAALALLLARARTVETPMGLAAVVLVAVAYGGCIEVLQGFVASRTTSVVDMLVNGIGASVGAALWLAVGR